MIYKKQILSIVIPLLIFIASFFIFNYFTGKIVQGDAASMYYPAKMLLEKNSLNFWNHFNDKYHTYYFIYTFSDVVIKNWGKIYPIQPPILILLTSFFIKLFGDSGFFIMPSFFSAVTLFFIYLIVKEKHNSISIGFISTFLLMSSPLFIIWAINVQNISIATSFFVISLYFFLRFIKNHFSKDLLYSGFFIGISIAIKISHAFFLPPYFLLLFAKNIKFTKKLRNVLIFILPILLLLVFVLTLNYIYFTDPFFIGYLQNNYHPIPSGYQLNQTLIPDTYLLNNTKLSTIISSIKLFFNGSLIQFFPLLIVAIIGIIINLFDPISIFSLLSIVIYLFYYGKLEPNLWKDFREEYYWTLTLGFFRYLLPIYILLNITFSSVIKKIFKTSYFKTKIIIFFLLIMFSYVSFMNSYNNKYGGDLKYFSEINNSITNYGKKLNKQLNKDSVILYDERWGFSYTYPYTRSYKWFYYDGIPPQVRFSHTKEVVSKLLADKKTVYFIHQDYPYNTLSQPMEDYLKENFKMFKVDNTDFPRMKTFFYQVL